MKLSDFMRTILEAIPQEWDQNCIFSNFFKPDPIYTFIVKINPLRKVTKKWFLLTDPVIYWELKIAINQVITRPLETLSAYKKMPGNGKNCHAISSTMAKLYVAFNKLVTIS